MTSNITIGSSSISLVAFPKNPPLKSVEFSFTDSVAVVTSPFTGQTQTQQWPGADAWSGTMTWPVLQQCEADECISFLMECRGMANAFMLGDPMKSTPRGCATGSSAPVITTQPIASNYLLWSSALSNSVWNKNQLSTVSDNSTPAPDGSPTATGIAASTPSTDAFLEQDVSSIPVGTVVTFSVYLRVPQSLPSRPVQIQIVEGSVNSVTSCTLSTQWQRFSVSHVVTTGTVGCFIGGNASIVDSGEGIFVAWPQLEYASTPGPYRSTQGTVATINTNVAMAQFIYTSGWLPDTYGLLLPGDYLQLGYRLHRVLNVVNSETLGTAVIEVWPSLRETPYSGQPIILNKPKGLFRLANNKRTWSSDFTYLTNLSFAVSEYR